MKTVTIKIFDIGFILKDERGFVGIIQMLNDSRDFQILITEFVKQLLDQFWEVYYKKLVRRHFLPYLACLFTVVYYLRFALLQVDEEREEMKI